MKKKYFSIVIPTYNSSRFLYELLSSTLRLKYLKEIVITDDSSNQKEAEEIDYIIKNKKFKDLNIVFNINSKNLGGFKNKYRGVELANSDLIYQVDSDNIITNKTIRFLNKQKNLHLVQNKELYLPSKIKLFRKFKNLESILFFRSNDVLFTNSDKKLSLYHVKSELIQEENDKKKRSFKDRTLKSILNIGNPIFLKKDYLAFCKEGFNLGIDISAGDAIALSYFYLKNGGKIIFNKNIRHYHRMRNDSYWYEGGDKSKVADLYFLDKILGFEIKKLQIPQKIYFITYGTKNFRIAKSHIVNLAKASGIFEKTIGFGKSDLSSNFKNKYSDILNMKRGAGYWIWKQEIISSVLNDIKQNDIVVYSDSGSSFNYYAKNRFYDYIDMLNDSDYGNFRIECESIHKEKDWTTKELLDYFNIDPKSDHFNTTQLEATHIIFKKNDHTINYLNEYKKLLNEDPYLITDSYNSKSQIDSFKENRHDQSIFSLLSKTLGGVAIKNETHFQKNEKKQFEYPFLAVRKHGHGIKDTAKFLINFEDIKNQPVFFK